MKGLRWLAAVIGLGTMSSSGADAASPMSGPEQAVIVRFSYGSTDLSRLFALERKLEADLAYLIGIVVLAIVLGRGLLRRSPRVRRGTTPAPVGIQQLSLRSQLRLLSGKGPEAFSRNPVLVILTVLLCAAIPFGLMILPEGGWDNLGRFEWLLIGFMELPPAFVIAIAIFGPKMPGKPTT